MSKGSWLKVFFRVRAVITEVLRERGFLFLGSCSRGVERVGLLVFARTLRVWVFLDIDCPTHRPSGPGDQLQFVDQISYICSFIPHGHSFEFAFGRFGHSRQGFRAADLVGGSLIRG